ncbi:MULTISPECIES: MFS transporter [Staphylococcus]|uniref:MFS transporter n=1 Tax=Staphylococcus hsinchuensis TaxID=3051183 RepID=A0ABZ3E9Z3_9STAP|nr:MULTISPECIES: MFS transporter [unclassified Staphylococcus]
MKKFNTLSSTLKSRLIAEFILNIASQSILPFMALYLTSKINAIFAGTFLIVNIIVTFGITFLGGFIGDHFNRKKIVNIVHALYAICLIILSITVNMNGIGLIIFCSSVFIFELLFALSNPIFEAATMDAIYEEVREYVYQLEYWMFNISTALGMLLGALLYLGHKHLLFLLFLVAMLISWYLFDKYYDVEQVFSENHESRSPMKRILNNYLTVLKDKYYLLFNLGYMLILMAELSLNSYVVVRLKEEFDSFYILGIHIDGVRMFSIIMIINTLVVVTMTFAINKLIQHHSKRLAFLIGGVLYTVGYGILTSATSFWLLCLVTIIATIGELIYSPIQNAQRFLMIPNDQRSTYATVGMVSFYGSKALARFSLILGTIFAPWMMSLYIVVTVIIGFALLFYAIFYNTKLKREGKSYVYY